MPARGATTEPKDEATVKERTIFDGLAPDAKVSHELIEAWEQTIAALDEEVAHLMRSRCAYMKMIIDGRNRLQRGKPS